MDWITDATDRLETLSASISEIPERLDSALCGVKSIASDSFQNGRINGLGQAIEALAGLAESVPANYSEAERRARLQALIDALQAITNCIGE